MADNTPALQPRHWAPSTPRRSRTDLLLEAFKRNIEAQRVMLDAAEDLGAVTVTIKLHAGTTDIKSVVSTHERIARRLR